MKRPSEKLQKEVLHSVFVTKYSMLIFMSGNNNSLVYGIHVPLHMELHYYDPEMGQHHIMIFNTTSFSYVTYSYN